MGEKHYELFESTINEMNETVPYEQHRRIFYYVIGGLSAKLSSSEDGKLSTEEICNLFKEAVDYVIKSK